VDGGGELADLSRRRGPPTLSQQSVDMALIVKPWHRIVGLRRKFSTRDATRRQRLKHWKAAAAQQAMNERGDKHSFAGLRKPRNAKPDCRIEQMAAELEKCASCE